MNAKIKTRLVAGALVLLALILVPAPLSPPHWLAERLGSVFGVSWKFAYLVAAVGLRALFYGSLGLVAAFAVKKSPSLRGRVLQMALVPLFVIGPALLIRSLKLMQVPSLGHLVIPAIACCLGAVAGLGLNFRNWGVTIGVSSLVVGAVLWVFTRGASGDLSRATRAELERIVTAGPALAQGEARFGALMEAAFRRDPARERSAAAVFQNRASILALGIAAGHERLARLAGLDPKDDLVARAASLGQGSSLRGREDWARHFAVSAALAVVESPGLSDAGGLLKEAIDALGRGSGFSFGDLAADRAGVRFAMAATRTEAEADGIRLRLERGFLVDDFFPQVSDLPESLSTETFRAQYGRVGSSRYRQVLAEIESRLDRCAAVATAR